jgi:hypothetical protein
MVVLQLQPWSDVFARLTAVGDGVERGALGLLFAIAVMFLGWGLATLLARLVRRLLRALRFDEGVRSLVGARAVARHEPAGVASWIVYWGILALTALLASELLGFSLAASVGDRLNEVVPRIVTSAVLFTVGSLVAMLLGGVTRRFLETAGMRAAKLQGQVVSAVLTGFAALLALEQLGFAAQFVMALGVVAAAATGLGLALAFGLGCRDLARDFVVEYLRSLDEEGPGRPE